MLKEERQQWILDKLGNDKRVTLLALSKELEVSYDSIRRDIIELEERGLLKKVHGGAITNTYLPMRVRNHLGIPNIEMSEIARKSLPFFKQGQTILMDGGSTHLYIIENLPQDAELTIITNNPPLALALVNHPNVEVVLLGGTFYKRYQITTGHGVLDQLSQFRIDTYFMGVVGMHPAEGCSIRNYEEAMMKRVMMAKSQKTIVTLTQEKLDTPANYRICGLEDIYALITSLPPESPQILPYHRDSLMLF